MKTTSEVFSSQRRIKKYSLEKIARDLHVKKEYLEALEAGDWQNLPEPPFVKGFIKSYAAYLGLDPSHMTALYRREYDEKKYPSKAVIRRPKKIVFTYNKLLTITIFAVVFTFVGYLTVQYLSLLSAPKLEIYAPQDDSTTSIPYVVISGQTQKDAQVAIEGMFVPIDEVGNFSYQLELKDGQNIIEIIASKRLSPKSKATRTIRLVR